MAKVKCKHVWTEVAAHYIHNCTAYTEWCHKCGAVKQSKAQGDYKQRFYRVGSDKPGPWVSSFRRRDKNGRYSSVRNS